MLSSAQIHKERFALTVNASIISSLSDKITWDNFGLRKNI